jgi:ABC-2 family transporter protein
MRRALRAELGKMRGTRIPYLILLFALVFFSGYAYYSGTQFDRRYWGWMTGHNNPWHLLFDTSMRVIALSAGFFMLTLVLWSFYLEYDNHFWPRLLTTPVGTDQIVRAKIMVVFGAAGLFLCLLYGADTFIIGPLTRRHNPKLFGATYFDDTKKMYAISFLFNLLFMFKSIVFQFWLLLKCRRNYVTAFSLGFTGLLLGFIPGSPYFNFFYIQADNRFYIYAIFIVFFISALFYFFIRKEVKKIFY